MALRHLHICSLIGLLCLSCLPALTVVAATGSKAADAARDSVVATVGGQHITEADVIAQNKEDFDRLQADNELRLHQLRQKEADSHYKLLQKQTDKLLDAKALEMEAKARGVSSEVVLADIKVSAVTETEARAFYDSNKARTNGRSFEQLQTEVTQYLALQHNIEATRSFYDALRARHAIASLLPPYRVAVEAKGPAKGKEHAAITIVEFADFQCPFCRQVESTVQTVLDKHPDDVRLVFRELPFSNLHPNALGAAHAAVCADRQGKFWPMHDAMYSDQTALGQNGLMDTAKRVGLDVDRFSSCLNDKDTLESVQNDARAADELNIDETPYFLINGRPMHGAVPAEQLEAVISDELHRIASKHG